MTNRTRGPVVNRRTGYERAASLLWRINAGLALIIGLVLMVRH